jgi:hypothetical protein
MNPEPKPPINTSKRLFDLVRIMRSELHQADLIDDDEYAWLCQYTFPDDPKEGSPSPRRLEDYDELRRKLVASQQELEGLKKYIENQHVAAWTDIQEALYRVDPERLGENGSRTKAGSLKGEIIFHLDSILTLRARIAELEQERDSYKRAAIENEQEVTSLEARLAQIHQTKTP